MKIMKKSLAMLLVLCMLISMVPLNAFATSTAVEDGTAVTATEATENDFVKVFHLDCGRKYFTVDQVKELIDSISNVGFSHMELAIGNDGLRLLLDDMSINANGTTYSSETIKSGIQAGNSGYSHSGEWTQDDMDAIISYAATKGIEIIPLVNNPGHMDSILAAMKSCGIDGYYKSSARTVDLENAEAVAFTQALVMKYAEYFAGKGCKYFNIGADEYANDYHTADSTGMGFGYLIDNNKYGNFVTYVNDLVAKICELDMTPIAFNDGIYFRENTSFGTFDNRLMIASWSGGWGGIKPASTTFLANKGHKILNTNERWYYVLGRAQSSNRTYCYESALSNAKSESATTVTDHKSVTPIGAMQCVWCDDPSVNYETYKSNVMTLINTFAENNPTYFTGPNVVEPEVPEAVTKTDEATGVAVTAPGLEAVEIKENTAIVTEECVTKTYAITLNGGAYTGKATVKIPYDTAFDGCNSFIGHVDEDSFEVTKEGDFFVCEVPHFSDLTIEGRAVVVDTVTSSGTTGPSYVKDVDGIDANAQYVIVYNNKALSYGSSITAVDVKENNDDTLTVPEDVTSANLLWTRKNSGMCNENSNQYLYIQNGTCSTSTNSQNVTFSDYNQGYQVYRDRSWTDYYLRYNSDWTGTSGSTYATRVELYKYSASTPSYVVTPELQESRINEYSVANDGYTKDTWSAYQAALKAAQQKLAEVKGATYAGENAARGALNDLITTVNSLEAAKNALAKAVQITITYIEGNSETVKTEKITVNDNATSVSLSNFNLNGKLYVVENETLTITPSTVSNYTVKVTETVEDLSKVEDLEIEYWITNNKVTINGSTSMQLSATDVHSAEGVAIKSLVPMSDGANTNEKAFWKGYLLPEGYHQKLDSENGADMTTNENGTYISKIRYWNGSWQIFNEKQWINVKDTDQIVAYYLQRTQVTTEITTSVVDWGETYYDWLNNRSAASWFWSGYVENGSKYVFADFAVVYEDGTQNPNTFPSDNTWFFHFDGHSATNPRVLGAISFTEQNNYEIYKVTVTDGTSTGYSKASSFESEYDEATETVVWDESMGGDPHLDGLAFTANRSGKLIRVYVKAVATDDTLNVVYIDEKFNDTLYNYAINVNAGTTYDNISPAPGEFGNNGRIDVTNCGIVNKLNIKQLFETDLTKVPEAKGKYNSELYAYTGSEISKDGKTLYLYYNINTNVLKPNFVVDFGLPITFSLNDVTNTADLAKTVTASARYGTVDYNSATKTFTYTPTKILQNIDVLSINILFDGETSVSTTNVGVTPATTVFYEETFINYDSNWTVPNAAAKLQATEVLGESSYYGYDAAYAGDNVGSNGTYAKSTTTGAAADFTFTGTGFELYANSKPTSGFVSVYSKGNLSKLYMINTKLTDIEGEEIKDTTYYTLPVISETDLPHGTYTVQIKQTNGENPVYIDGVRVVGTIKEDITTNAEGETVNNSIYKEDKEDNPVFHELRDYVLNAIGVENLKESDYIGSGDRESMVKAVKDMAGQVYNALGDGNKAVLINKEGTTFTQAQAQDLLDNGPKNEVYLYPGQTLAFSVTTERVMQLGLKAPTGSAKFDIIVDDKSLDLDELSTTVDLFYKIAEKGATTHTVSVNVKEGVLSVTDLKICDDPNAKFNDLTQEDIENVLLGIYGLGEEPSTPDVPSTPDIPVDSQPGTSETPAPNPDTPEPGVPTPDPGKPDPKPEHKCKMKEEIKPATTKKDGKIVVKCKECGKVESTKVIYKISTVKLSSKEYTYNGKIKSPKLIVKNSKGKTISSKYYTVKKPTGRKDVGKYTYTIKFKGRYEGTKSLTLTVKPKATSVKAVTASKKAFTVKWSKVSKQATGYEIMYATNAKFTKGKKTVKVTKLNTTSKKISKLKAKQKYYVKVRTYKTVKVNGKKTNIYSAWSNYKTVTTKR